MTSPRPVSKHKVNKLGLGLSVGAFVLWTMLAIGFGVQMQAEHHITSAAAPAASAANKDI